SRDAVRDRRVQRCRARDQADARHRHCARGATRALGMARLACACASPPPALAGDTGTCHRCGSRRLRRAARSREALTSSESNPADVAWVLEQLWAPIVAVTAAHDGRENGLISSTVVTASLLPESPRIVVQLSKTNLTHDLVCTSGALAVHFLPDDERGLELFRALGVRTGRQTSKLDDVATAPGQTGAPILQDAVAYVEGRVATTHDVESSTIVVADIVGG